LWGGGALAYWIWLLEPDRERPPDMIRVSDTRETSIQRQNRVFKEEYGIVLMDGLDGKPSKDGCG